MSKFLLFFNVDRKTFFFFVVSPVGSGVMTTLYFFGSFAFLVGRTVAVTLLAARINDQSKIALPAIYNCPASYFTIEVSIIVYFDDEIL